MISFKQTGTFSKTDKFLEHVSKYDFINTLNKYGAEGVSALSLNTPIDSGITASSWSYKITNNKKYISIAWYNKNTVDGIPIIILLQYGHATKNGGYVQGKDFINPIIRPIFDKISNSVWREVIQ